MLPVVWSMGSTALPSMGSRDHISKQPGGNCMFITTHCRFCPVQNLIPYFYVNWYSDVVISNIKKNILRGRIFHQLFIILCSMTKKIYF